MPFAVNQPEFNFSISYLRKNIFQLAFNLFLGKVVSSSAASDC